MSRRAAIPSTTDPLLSPMKERLEILGGDRPGFAPIATLSTGASLSDVIAKVNEIIVRMQGR
jgi:hypothetical protein